MAILRSTEAKPILELAWNPNLGDKSALKNIWEPYYSYYQESVLVLDTAENVKKLIRNRKTNLGNSKVLYFGKTSKFPRFKLSESDFKRCIKLDKADVMVIDDDMQFRNISTKVTILDDGINYYYLDESKVARVYPRYGTRYDEKAFKADPVKYIKDNELFYGSEINVIYSGNATLMTVPGSTDYETLLNNPSLKVVTDKEVDVAINSNFDVLTTEDVKSICDMLDSSDSATRGLGLKMLCGYDVSKTPLTVRTILGLREYLTSNSEWKSVGVKQVLSTIQWKGFGYFPRNIYNITQYNDTVTYSPEDITLVRELYKKEFKKYIEGMIENINYDFYKALGIELKYEIS